MLEYFVVLTGIIIRAVMCLVIYSAVILVVVALA